MYLFYFILRIVALFSTKVKKLVDGQNNALKEIQSKVQPNERYIWFHAASVGEFEQGRQIIESVKSMPAWSNRKVILTFFSPSGYEMRKNYAGADIVSYLPFPTRKNAKRFYDIVQPEKIIFIKYEFWPAYLKYAYKRKIETYLISAIFNKHQLFFRWYGGWYRRLLNYFTHIFVQDTESQALLERYKITNVTVAGDTRFDRVKQIASQPKELPAFEHFLEQTDCVSTTITNVKKVIVAGSTWPSDERLLARYLEEHPDIKLILVPHEIDDKHMHTIFQIFQGRYIRYTEATWDSLLMSRCLVVDKMGMLSSIYRYGKVAYIGGGFGVGIHNTLEAAVYGMPVVFGPNYHRFREANRLIACGGGYSISNYEELCQTLDNLLEDASRASIAAYDYVESELGATRTICQTIFN